MATNQPDATSRPLNEDIDAARWAKEFIDQFTGYSVGGNTIDEGLMLGWFANAIMAGYDRAQRTNSAVSETVTHIDHPARHWDRTCPACRAERTVFRTVCHSGEDRP